MSCTIKLKNTETKGSTFAARVWNLTGRDLSADSFEAVVKGSAGQSITTIAGTVTGATVIFPLSVLEKQRSARYVVEYWADMAGVGREMIGLEDFVISDLPAETCAPDPVSAQLIFEEVIIEAAVTNNILNLNLGWEYLTAEQIAQLQQPAIDAATEADQAAASATAAAGEANSAAQTAATSATAADQAAASATAAAGEANSAAQTATASAQTADQAAATATASAQTATASAQTADQAAATATTAAQTATASAQTADQAAATATTAAQTATASAQTADQAAATATTAAQTAQTATEEANSAAAAASAAKGWQPFIVQDSTTVAGKSLLKLQDWIGGTGDKPTDYVGQWQKADGTYTSVASEANNIKGEQGDNLIASYTHTNNKRVSISAIDYATGTFTSVAHGFTNNTNVYFSVPFPTVFPTAVQPNGASLEVHYIVNATADTFQLSRTSGGAPITISAKGTTDLTKFFIEKRNDAVVISGLNHQEFKVKITGRTLRNGAFYLYLNGNGNSMLSNITGTSTSNMIPNGATVLIDLMVTFRLANNILFIHLLGSLITHNTDTANFETLYNKSYAKEFVSGAMTSFTYEVSGVQNGTQIKIYKL